MIRCADVRRVFTTGTIRIMVSAQSFPLPIYRNGQRVLLRLIAHFWKGLTVILMRSGAANRTRRSCAIQFGRARCSTPEARQNAEF